MIHGLKWNILNCLAGSAYSYLLNRGVILHILPANPTQQVMNTLLHILLYCFVTIMLTIISFNVGLKVGMRRASKRAELIKSRLEKRYGNEG